MRSNSRLPLLAAIIALMTGCTHAPYTVYDWMRERGSATYRAPTAQESAELATAFAHGMAGHGARDWDRLGYEVRATSDGQALRESLPVHRGWGAYVFRTGPARALVVQAPHVESDLRTGELGLELYRETGARLLAVNSAHRSLPQADQARDAGAPFVLIGREAARPGVDAVVVQVHGYGAATAQRHGLSPETVVVSNGTRVPDPALRAAARCLTGAGFDARVFPDQARYPGGTGNVVGQAVTAGPQGRFVHLELGAGLRDGLLGDPARLRRFAACL